MMAAQPSLAVNFLSDAAHLLREAAPETSAYLMSECADHLSRQNFVVSDVYRQHVCTACGLIMIPGQKTELKLETQRVYRKKTKPAKRGVAAATAGPCKTFTCGHCQSITRVQLPVPERATRSKVSKKVIAPVSERTVENPKSTANSSSRKRAKNRKAGLQALLSSQQKPSSGLSLASFMK